VRAINASGPTYSNGSETAIWSFATGNVPGAFTKSTPANGALGLSLNPTLSWGSSSGATSYEYCYDNTIDNNCSTWTSTGVSTSIGISGLSTNTTYEWHVRAKNAVDTTYSNGLPAAFWSFTTGVMPGAFSKTTPIDGATGVALNPTLSWGSSSGATNYEYCYSLTNTCSVWNGVGASTSVGLSGLLPGTTYYWHVRAYNVVGQTYSNASESALWSFTTGSLPAAFSKTAPVNGATGISASPTLSWGSSSGAASYEYCYDTTNDNACTPWISTGTNTSVNLSGLSLNMTYYWHVKALNTYGETFTNGSATAFWNFTTGNLPGAFAKTAPANGATNLSLSPTLSWGSSSGAASYEYCYDTSNDNACTPWISTGTNTSVNLSGLSLNVTYYWHVKALNAHGETFSNGSAAAFWNFTTGNLPGDFLKVAPANGAADVSLSPTLSWGSSSGAASYEYCYDTTNDSACTTWISTGTNTSVGLTGLTQGMTYYWHVRANNDYGTTYSNGSATAFWSFQTQIQKVYYYLPVILK
jgi:hypothetical protein